MKSHEFAKHLTLMAKVLKSGANVELEDLSFSHIISSNIARKEIEKDEIPHTLHLLVGLNNVNKQKWISLIEEFGFQIEIRPK